MSYCANHKPKKVCKIRTCTNQAKSKGVCKDCGVRRYSNTCASHYADGKYRPRLRGKGTTKQARLRRKMIVVKQAIPLKEK